MTNFDNIEHNLKIILHSGDLYDVICQKEGLKVSQFSFIKYNVLFFSRLLYILTFGLKKINSFKSPITKVYNAQEKIRELTGLNIDIIRNKEIESGDTLTKNFLFVKDIIWSPKRYLAIFYEDDTQSPDSYLNNLRKIYHFAQNHDINKIYLNKNDLSNFSFDSNLPKKRLSSILNTTMIPSLDKHLIELTPRDLLNLINSFWQTNLDNDLLNYLTTNSQDLIIQKAFQDFSKNKDFTRFKNIVEARLSLFLNSESSKDKIHGKIYNTIIIKNEYLQVISKDAFGNIISSNLMTIYDYYDVSNYNQLFNKLTTKTDNCEELHICALYLYLMNSKSIIVEKKANKESFYDYIYRKYLAKQKGEITHIHGLRDKSYKNLHELFGLSLSYVTFIFLAALSAITNHTIKSLWQFFELNQEYNYFSTVYDNIKLAYDESLELERKLMSSITTSLYDLAYEFTQDLDDNLNISRTGDSPTSNTDPNKILASINYLNPDYDIPQYFATGYSEGGEYEKGSMVYEITEPTISLNDFCDNSPVLSISYPLKRQELKNSIKDEVLKIPLKFFPLGASYKIFSLHIIDANDNTLQYNIDYHNPNLELTKSDLKLLKSMRNPKILISFSLDESNAFTNNLPYMDKSAPEIKEAIRKGLNLNEDASLDNMLLAIKEKFYSATPLKDAALSREIKKLNEEEYFETISSLDSLICNLAASLAVELDDELVYVVGYYSRDKIITGDESHAWAMKSDGTIIDTTPYKEDPNKPDYELESFFKNILLWCNQNKMPFILGLSLALLLTNTFFGKKIKFYLKICKVKNFLNKKDVAESYAKIKEVLYGGINIPLNYSSEELVDAISHEFASFSKEELEEIKQELKKLKKEGEPISKTSLKLVDNISEILENAPELKRHLTQKH